MARATTPTFIVELPLTVTRPDAREMGVRLELGRQLYNACLGEGLRRLEHLREGPAWAQACAMPRRKDRKPNKERASAFTAARTAAGFTSAAISAFGTRCKNEAKWNDGRARTDARVGAHECQVIAQQAFSALEMYAFGQRGRPRFKGKRRPLHSLQGKSADSGIYWNPNSGCLEWGALRLRAKMPPLHKDRWLERALACRTKFARIVWRLVKGERRWFVQLAQEGFSPQKYHTVADATVGLDVGPSTLAVVCDRAAALLALAPEVKQPWAATRRLQRAMDRSRRATNPHCYQANGTFKCGTQITVRSRGYLKLRGRLSETERVLEKRRSRSHGRLSNCILGLGNRIQTEKLNYTAFQKSFGRSTQVKAVGSLMLKLRRKAERAGGEFRELNTRALKLSQYDHCTGTCSKKRLGERWHVLGDGSGVVQRDVYSAFLAAIADQNLIHPSRAAAAWPAAQSLLARAGWIREQPVSVAGLLAATSTANKLPAPEPVARERASIQGDTSKWVGVSRTSKKVLDAAA
jgi:putative transposase